MRIIQCTEETYHYAKLNCIEASLWPWEPFISWCSSIQWLRLGQPQFPKKQLHWRQRSFSQRNALHPPELGSDRLFWKEWKPEAPLCESLLSKPSARALETFCSPAISSGFYFSANVTVRRHGPPTLTSSSGFCSPTTSLEVTPLFPHALLEFKT